MYVHLDDLLVIDHNNAVAEGFEEQTQLVRLGGDFRVAADDELRAVGEVDLAVKFRRNAAKNWAVSSAFSASVMSVLTISPYLKTCIMPSKIMQRP